MMNGTPSCPMSEEVAAIMPKAVEIMAAATISGRDDFKEQLFNRTMHAAIVTAVTGVETSFTVTPEIEDGVITGFSMYVEGEVINKMAAENIMSDIMKTVIFNAKYDFEQERKKSNLVDFLNELFGKPDQTDEVDFDDISDSPDSTEQKPSEQVAS